MEGREGEEGSRRLRGHAARKAKRRLLCCGRAASPLAGAAPVGSGEDILFATVSAAAAAATNHKYIIQSCRKGFGRFLFPCRLLLISFALRFPSFGSFVE
jgi:hypothetical protein